MNSPEKRERFDLAARMAILGATAVLAAGAVLAVEGALDIVNPTPSCNQLIVANKGNTTYAGANIYFNGYKQPIKITYMTGNGFNRTVTDDPTSQLSDGVYLPYHSGGESVSASIYELDSQHNKDSSPISVCNN